MHHQVLTTNIIVLMIIGRTIAFYMQYVDIQLHYTPEYAHVGSQEFLFYHAEISTHPHDNTEEKRLQSCQS